MPGLTCAEVGELAGAYALGLLDADERATIEEHLAEHWHEEYASARAAVLALASAAPEAEPSPELRERVLGIARSEVKRDNRRWIPGLLAGAAAAGIVLAVLGFSGVLQQSTRPAQQLIVQNTQSGAFLEVAVGSGTKANIRLGGLPPRPGSEVYQVWRITPGQDPESVCVIGADRDGPWAWDVEMRLEPGDIVAVTVEPDGKRTTPSQAPFLSGQY